MNGIAHASKMFDFLIYANDAILSTTFEIVVRPSTYLTTSDILNNELSMVNNWLKVNKLSLNIQKIKYMIFHTKKNNFQSVILKLAMLLLNKLLSLIFLD